MYPQELGWLQLRSQLLASGPGSIGTSNRKITATTLPYGGQLFGNRPDAFYGNEYADQNCRVNHDEPRNKKNGASG